MEDCFGLCSLITRSVSTFTGERLCRRCLHGLSVQPVCSPEPLGVPPAEGDGAWGLGPGPGTHGNACFLAWD